MLVQLRKATVVKGMDMETSITRWGIELEPSPAKNLLSVGEIKTAQLWPRTSSPWVDVGSLGLKT